MTTHFLSSQAAIPSLWNVITYELELLKVQPILQAQVKYFLLYEAIPDRLGDLPLLNPRACSDPHIHIYHTHCLELDLLGASFVSLLLGRLHRQKTMSFISVARHHLGW